MDMVRFRLAEVDLIKVGRLNTSRLLLGAFGGDLVDGAAMRRGAVGGEGEKSSSGETEGRGRPASEEDDCGGF
jgi:hypothetical protein